MASEIRVNKIINRSGLSTVTFSDTGAIVSGIVTANNFSGAVTGSGANLTSIPAGQLTGTVADARLSTVSSSKLSGALPALDGSALTGVGIGTDGSVNTSGIVTATAFVSDTPLSHRNIIVNGAMNVAQRGTSSASADFASVDRMKMSVTNIDQLAFLQKQTSDGPDGFSKCFEFDVTTVENALDADDLVYMRYAVEAQDLAPFFNANGSGKNFTLSFYVKAYQTGTYQVAIYKADATAQFITRTYTIASSGVWQRVVLNFTGDTGTSGINADNGLGFQISFMLAAGTNYTSGSQQPTWGGWPGNPGFAAGQAVNTLSSTDNYWRITGIQLELGDVATPFEHRSYGEELRRCQRYFRVFSSFSGIAAAAGAFQGPLSYDMRSAPSVALSPSGQARISDTAYSDFQASTVSGLTEYNATSTGLRIHVAGFSGLSVQKPMVWLATGTNQSDVHLSAEL